MNPDATADGVERANQQQQQPGKKKSKNNNTESMNPGEENDQ